MADVLVIVPPDVADGFRLAGARVRPAADSAAAQDQLLRALDDPDAGIIALADHFYAALDTATRQSVERRYRPVVVAIPIRAVVTPEQRHRGYLEEMLRRAIGLKVVLGSRRPNQR